jgi:hypothetical protein
MEDDLRLFSLKTPSLGNDPALSLSIKEHHEIAEMVRAYKMKHSPEWFKTDEMCPEL